MIRLVYKRSSNQRKVISKSRYIEYFKYDQNIISQNRSNQKLTKRKIVGLKEKAYTYSSISEIVHKKNQQKFQNHLIIVQNKNCNLSINDILFSTYMQTDFSIFNLKTLYQDINHFFNKQLFKINKDPSIRYINDYLSDDDYKFLSSLDVLFTEMIYYLYNKRKISKKKYEKLVPVALKIYH